MSVKLDANCFASSSGLNYPVNSLNGPCDVPVDNLPVADYNHHKDLHLII